MENYAKKLKLAFIKEKQRWQTLIENIDIFNHFKINVLCYQNIFRRWKAGQKLGVYSCNT